ncbi:hypothetical protein GE061_008578 [Apolygus lucorum]|uniref:Uncharacterized protein n=1 Tax=Apolygus lucorum TaxID=248454 RepID=A0A8S9WKC7_APOLU|nr:hypothetical protein GE061_008578 [Apolygus lucorum]
MGRVLIYYPRSLAESYRSQENFEIFWLAMNQLRAKCVSRPEANEELSRSEVLLSGDEEPDGLSVRDPRSKELLKKLGDEVSSLKALPSRVGQLESKLDSIESGIQKLISERSKHTYSSSEDGNSELDESDQGSEGQEMLSWQDTLQPLGRSEDPPLGEKLWVGPTPSVVGPGLSPLTSASSSFLNPSTVEQAPEYALPEEEINSRAIDCQHLGRESWNRVRYAEAAQRLHRGGVFQPLQVNGTFLKQYMPLDNIHKKRERFLATLSYGVLAERQAFNEAQTAFLLAHPEVKEAFDRQFLQGSKFRSVADDILQMIFGGRAEVIAERRKMLEPSDFASRRALQAIPPSTTHLFEEEALRKLVTSSGFKLAPEASYVQKRKRIFSESGSSERGSQLPILTRLAGELEKVPAAPSTKDEFSGSHLGYQGESDSPPTEQDPGPSRSARQDPSSENLESSFSTELDGLPELRGICDSTWPPPSTSHSTGGTTPVSGDPTFQSSIIRQDLTPTTVGGVYMISHFSELRVTIYSVLKMQWFYGQHLGQRQTLLPFANQGGGLNVLHLKVTAMSPSAWTPS